MNGPPHFQWRTNNIVHDTGLRADTGFFINYLGNGGAHHTDPACRLSALLQACKNDNIKAGANKLELSYTEFPFFSIFMKEGTLYTDPANMASNQTLVCPTIHS